MTATTEAGSPEGRHPARRMVLGGAVLGSALAAGGVAGGAAARLTSAPAPAPVRTTGEDRVVTVPAGGDVAAALRGGARQVRLDAGEYPVSRPLVLPRGCLLTGTGQGTRLKAVAALPAMVLIGDGGPVDGVSLESLVLDCDERAQRGVSIEVNGRDGHYQGEPDPVIRLDNLWVYDSLEDGMHYAGSDTRSCTTSRVRVRRAGRHGFHITVSDSWWTACEATTINARGDSAGFFVGGTNNFFQSCKAWYCRDYGWRVRGTRNRFTGCESQDTRSHGWFIEYDRNVFVACTADTAGMHDVGGAPGSADGFYVSPTEATALVGCQAYDRRPGRHPAQQRYGFNVDPALVKAGRLVGATGWDNLKGLVGHAR